MVCKSRFYPILVLFLFLLIGCGGGNTSNSNPAEDPTYSITLSWETPISRTDGKPLPDLAGYNVYYGKAPQSYSQTFDAGNVKTYTIQNLPGGTYYVAITAYDSVGNETEYSDEVKKTVP